MILSHLKQKKYTFIKNSNQSFAIDSNNRKIKSADFKRVHIVPVCKGMQKSCGYSVICVDIKTLKIHKIVYLDYGSIIYLVKLKQI